MTATTTLLTALGLILTMTAAARSLAAAIRTAKTPRQREVALARFRRLNEERCRLVEEHGLETWAATL